MSVLHCYLFSYKYYFYHYSANAANNNTTTTNEEEEEEERLVGLLSALDETSQLVEVTKPGRRFRAADNEQQCSYIMKWAESLIPPTDPTARCEQREAGRRAGKVVKQSREKKQKKKTLTLLSLRPSKTIKYNSCAIITICIFMLLYLTTRALCTDTAGCICNSSFLPVNNPEISPTSVHHKVCFLLPQSSETWSVSFLRLCPKTKFTNQEWANTVDIVLLVC